MVDCSILPQHRGSQPQTGPVVYRLGHISFTDKSWVRFPAGLQNIVITNSWARMSTKIQRCVGNDFPLKGPIAQ